MDFVDEILVEEQLRGEVVGHVFVANESHLEMYVDGSSRIPTGKDRHELNGSIYVALLTPSQEGAVRSPLHGFGGISPERVAVPEVYVRTFNGGTVA